MEDMQGKVLILQDLMPGTKRFGELNKSIGSVSPVLKEKRMIDMRGLGTFINTGAVIAGGLIGLCLRNGLKQ